MEKNVSRESVEEKTQNSGSLNEMSLLQLIELTDEYLKGCELDDVKLKEVQPILHILSVRLGIPVDECMWLCGALNQTCDICSFNIDDMNTYFHCKPIRGLKYQYLFDTLREKEWFVGPDKDHTYGVAHWVVESIRKNEKPQPKVATGLDVDGWLCEIWDVLNDDKLSRAQRERHIDSLCDSNSELPIVKAYQSLAVCSSSMDEQVLLMTICRYVFENDECTNEYHIEDLFENKCAVRRYIHTMQHGGGLIMANAIEFLNENGQVNNRAWKLTDDAKQRLFADTDIKITQEEEHVSQLVRADKITTKKLFYNEIVSKQVDDLRSILEIEHFKEIQDRLSDKGMRRGFTCIFYGTPGTGKTETALQLARETGRDIMQVDISNLRSKWVGDSEKNIKAVFGRYRSICKHTKNAPILLFNEADAIFNKRNDSAVYAVDKMENAIQNIILQEMETFDGIMIATTNLTNNMDSAFERRFLYKIEFTKPTPNERKHI